MMIGFKKGDRVWLRSPFDDAEFETNIVYEIVEVDGARVWVRALVGDYRSISADGAVTVDRLEHVPVVERLGDIA